MRLGRSREAQSSLDYLVVGLGNPGRRYERTRHNLGWMVLDDLAGRLAASWRGKFSGRLAEVRDGDARLGLLVPETYMNDSGRSIAPALRFYKLPPDRLVVVHDEVDLELGAVRVKAGGGLAGHNGLRSVTAALGTQEFLRVRLGVGKPERGERMAVADWVLQPFPADYDVAALVEQAADCTLAVVREGPDAAMRRCNVRA